jgi:hypothetical protein
MSNCHFKLHVFFLWTGLKSLFYYTCSSAKLNIFVTPRRLCGPCLKWLGIYRH